jgi:hypothetical protein
MADRSLPPGSSSSTAIEIAKCGTPWRSWWFRRAGRRSTGLVRIALDLAAFLADDAPIGPRILKFVIIVCSARLSAIDCEIGRPFFDTCSCSTSPKSRRRRSAALRAARVVDGDQAGWKPFILTSPNRRKDELSTALAPCRTPSIVGSGLATLAPTPASRREERFSRRAGRAGLLGGMTDFRSAENAGTMETPLSSIAGL